MTSKKRRINVDGTSCCRTDVDKTLSQGCAHAGNALMPRHPCKKGRLL